MFKVITNKADFIQNPVLEMNEEQLSEAPKDTIRLFGKTYYMYADEWKHHVHIKCTDRCDADCDFCIERSERNNPQNAERVMMATRDLLAELAEQGHLRTVSITGGEPTLFRYFEKLVDMIGARNPTLLSINTNGRHLERLPAWYDGWVNISKHAITDADVFVRDFNVTPAMIAKFKASHPRAKVRMQCVLGTTTKMSTVGNIVDFIYHFKDVADDFSFRNLIIENYETKVSELLFDFRQLLLDSGEFVEQVIQDYYVYETFRMFGTLITFSWSNMKELREYNESHDNNFLEEIIVHPDGSITGSWNKKSLIIQGRINHEGDEYIPCRGEGCTHRCPRYDSYLKEQMVKERVVYRSSVVQSCHTSVDSCGSTSVQSCGSVSSC